MEYELKVVEHVDEYDDIEWQEVYDEDGKELFSVRNLTDCPEDATIGRDLFSAGDFLSAVRLGMKLANYGYTDIVVREVERV